VFLAVRAAIVCACLCVIAAFLPAGEVVVTTPLKTHRRAASLYQLGSSSDAAKQFLARYRGSLTKRVGEKVLEKVSTRLRGRLAQGASDAQDALTTLDSIRDEDVDTVGRAVMFTLYALVGLHLAVVLLWFRVGPRSRRLRVAFAAAASVIAAALAVAIYFVLDRIVTEANAEVGRSMFALRGGATILLVCGVALLASAGAVVVTYIQLRRRLASERVAAAPA
jgi:hypothetical protein